MVIVKIWGGLGNQMFQYAFALRHCKMGHTVRLDISYYEHYSCHQGLELYSRFDVPLMPATESDFTSLKYINEVDLKIEFEYCPQLFCVDNAYFVGYWQNHRYLEGIKATILKTFSLRANIFEIVSKIELVRDIRKTNSVSVHVRRGDYLRSKKLFPLELDYYNTALNRTNSLLMGAKYFLFSDDVSWSMEWLSSYDITYVEENKGVDSYLDMQLMSVCKHNIIANSTFSWWGALLNTHRNKFVAAPCKWLKGDSTDVINFLSKKWAVI